MEELPSLFGCFSNLLLCATGLCMYSQNTVRSEMAFSLSRPCQNSLSTFHKVTWDLCDRNMILEPQAGMQTNGHSPLFMGWHHLILFYGGIILILLYFLYIYIISYMCQRWEDPEGLDPLMPIARFHVQQTQLHTAHGLGCQPLCPSSCWCRVIDFIARSDSLFRSASSSKRVVKAVGASPPLDL